jgi:hypothetical protein
MCVLHVFPFAAKISVAGYVPRCSRLLLTPRHARLEAFLKTQMRQSLGSLTKDDVKIIFMPRQVRWICVLMIDCGSDQVPRPELFHGKQRRD